MKFGIFFLGHNPRPWDEGSEARLYREALEQMELADELGFHSAWVSEHHFLEEYAHFSTPELLLAAASQRTSRIRLGHGIVTMPPLVNPPIRVAERIGALDVLSNGRVEFGSGESLGIRELGGFGVDIENKSQQWDEALQAVVGMLEQDCYEGFSGDVVSVLGRPVYPRPIQKPTPPLWVACSRTEGLAKPALRGAGALCLTPTQEPEKARETWTEPYYQLLESDDWIPLSRAVNPNLLAVVTAFPHRDGAAAREIMGEHIDWVDYATGHFRLEQGYDAAHSNDVWGQFKASGHKAHPSLLKAIGDVDQVRDFMRQYEDAGFDHILLQMQVGKMRHEDILESMRLFAAEILPEFHERDAAHQEAKMQRLQPAIDRALERRERAQSVLR